MTVETKSLKFPMEWKAFIQVVVIIAMLIGASVAGVQVSMSVSMESRVADIESRLDAPVNSSLAGMQKPFTEIISMVDAYYVRQNGTDGRLILPYNTNKTYIQQQAIGNCTPGSLYVKEMTLASGLVYGTTILIIQQYQGQLSYYSNNALVYTVKAGGLNATVIYTAILNASTNYVQAYRLLVENGTSFPSSPSSGYIFFRTDWNLLTFYNGSAWTNCTTGSVDDLTVYLLKDGSRALTGNWNVGGSYGIYGATWMNATQMDATSFYMNGQLIGFSQPYSFLVDYNASSGLYRSWHGANSTLAYQSTNASKVANNAFGNITTGMVYFKSATYQIDTNITIGKSEQLIAEAGTLFNVTANLSGGCVVVDGTDTFADWSIENLRIDMNQYTGHAIYVPFAGTSNSVMKRDDIKNVMIEDVKVGYSGIYLVNPFYGIYENIFIRTYGTGITIREHASISIITGNSVFTNIKIFPATTNVIGIDMLATKKDPANLCVWNRLQMGGGVTYLAGTIGLKIVNASRYSTFTGLDLEELETCMYFENTSSIAIFGNYALGANVVYGLRIVGDCQNIDVHSMVLKGWTDETFASSTKTLKMIGGYLYGTINASANSYFNGVSMDGYMSGGVGLAEYVIRTVGTQYISTNCHNGQIFRSTNAKLVIDNVQGNMSGGTIFFEQGFYPIANVTVKAGVSWIGAGMGANGTVFTMASQTAGSVLIIEGQSVTSSPNMTILSDFRIDGQKALGYNGTGIYAYSASWIPAYTMIDHVGIYNCNSTGFYTKNVAGFFISNCRMQYCNKNGMYIGSSDNIISDSYVGDTGGNCLYVSGENNNFANIHVWGAGVTDVTQVYGVYISGQTNSFVGGQSECNARIGIFIENGDQNTITGWLIWGNGDSTLTNGRGISLLNADSNIITGCQIFNNTAVGNFQQYAIYESGTSGNNTFVNNNVCHNIYNITNALGPIYSVATGTQSIFRDNAGFATENSGSVVNATATTFTITHGLTGTPTFVGCSFNSTQIDGWGWTATSTTITVTVHNRVTTDQIVACYWDAKYIP